MLPIDFLNEPRDLLHLLFLYFSDALQHKGSIFLTKQDVIHLRFMIFPSSNQQHFSPSITLFMFCVHTDVEGKITRMCSDDKDKDGNQQVAGCIKWPEMEVPIVGKTPPTVVCACKEENCNNVCKPENVSI